jgi:hypothetical protein
MMILVDTILLNGGLGDVTWCGVLLKYKPVSWDEAEDISTELGKPFTLNGEDGEFLPLHGEFLDFVDSKMYESVRICTICVRSLRTCFFSWRTFWRKNCLQFQKSKLWYFGFQPVQLQFRLI